MKIVFWSPYRGKGATTSNLLLTALNIAYNGRLRSCIISTDCHDRIQSSFISRDDEEFMLKTASGFGIGALLRDVKGDMLSEENLADAALEIAGNKRLALYISAALSDPKVIATSLDHNWEKLSDALSRHFPLVFIDTKGGFTQFNQKVLGTADLIVVCLNQDNQVIETVFEQCDFSNKNYMFIMGNYDKKINCSIQNLRNKHKEVTQKNSAEILHFADFADARNSHNLKNWAASIQKYTPKQSVYEFHKSVSKASMKMLKLLNVGGNK